MAQHSLLKSPNKVIPALIAAAVVVAGLGIATALKSPTAKPDAKTPDPNASTAPVKSKEITALGRLEPAGEVYKIAAPGGSSGGSSGGGGRVLKVLVKEGDTVKKGQRLAFMDSKDQLLGAAMQAEARVKEAETRLATVKSGAKAGDIGAQRSDIQAKIATVESMQAKGRGLEAEAAAKQAAYQAKQAAVGAKQAVADRLIAEVAQAEREAARYSILAQEGASSAAIAEDRRLTLATKRQQLTEAKREVDQSSREADQSRSEASQASQAVQAALKDLNRDISEFEQAKQKLSSVAQVRPEDVREAEAAVLVAQTGLQRARADLETALVLSPIDGKVLKINTKDGESVSDKGIVELGNTAEMDVVAEVYETDLDRIQGGLTATITSPALAEPLEGRVYKAGWQIRKNDVLNTDPAADTDVRVVEVRIRLKDARPVERLTNLQVKVKIMPAVAP
jgi:HlyD family secretion protein